MQPLMGIESINSCDMAFASVHQKGESPFSGQALSVDLQAAERFTALLEEGHALTKEALNVCERRLEQSQFPHQAFEPLTQASTHFFEQSVAQAPAPEQKGGVVEGPSQLLATASFEQVPVESRVERGQVTEMPAAIPQTVERAQITTSTTHPSTVAPQLVVAQSSSSQTVAPEHPEASLDVKPMFVSKPVTSHSTVSVSASSQRVPETLSPIEQPKSVERGAVLVVEPQPIVYHPETKVDPIVVTEQPLTQPELPKDSPQPLPSEMPHGIGMQSTPLQPNVTPDVVVPVVAPQQVAGPRQPNVVTDVSAPAVVPLQATAPRQPNVVTDVSAPAVVSLQEATPRQPNVQPDAVVPVVAPQQVTAPRQPNVQPDAVMPVVAPQQATAPRQPNVVIDVSAPAVVSLQETTPRQPNVQPDVVVPVVAPQQVSPLMQAPASLVGERPVIVADGVRTPQVLMDQPLAQSELPKATPQTFQAEMPQGVGLQTTSRQPNVAPNVVAPIVAPQQVSPLTQVATPFIGEHPVAPLFTPEQAVESKVVYFRRHDFDGLSREAVQVIAPTMLPITLPHQQVETIAQPIASHEVVQHFVMAAQAVADAMLVSSGFVRGEGQLLVRLRPEVLGGSEIRLVATEGTLTVIVNPATQDVQTLVEANRTQFEQYLAEKVTSWRLAVTVKRGGNDDERL